MRKKRLILGIAFIIGLAASVRPADANLLENPSFSTGDFTGWTVTGDGITVDSFFSNIPADAYDASFSAAADDPTAGVLSQTVTTTPGESYQLSFSLVDEAGFPGNIFDTFTVTFGGFSETLDGQDATPYSDGVDFYTTEVFAIPGSDISTTNTTLSFEGQNGLFADWNLDDASLDPVPVSVPEPSTLLVLVGNLMAMAVVRRARRAPRDPNSAPSAD